MKKYLALITRNSVTLILVAAITCPMSSQAGKDKWGHYSKDNLNRTKHARKFEEAKAKRKLKEYKTGFRFDLQIEAHPSNLGLFLYGMVITGVILEVGGNLPRKSHSSEARITPYSCLFSSTSDHFSTQNFTLRAQEVVQAKEMKARVKEILKENPVQNSRPVPVVVIDSGFDRKVVSQFAESVHLKEFVRVGSKIQAKQIDRDYIENRPKSSHGTAVASLIGNSSAGMAENGIALSLYQSLERGDRNGLIEQIEIACQENQDPDGLTIINLCMSAEKGETDEGVFSNEGDFISSKALRDEVLYKDRIKKFGKMGCLVVKSAGNKNYRGETQNVLEDAYLRVQALDDQGRLADFTSLGEISAPGEEVGVVLDGGTLGSMSGTSFATPLVSGIAAQVLRVLKSDSYFRDLPPSRRVALVTHILKLSEVNRMINGLRAVEWAHAVNKGLGLFKNSSIEIPVTWPLELRSLYVPSRMEALAETKKKQHDCSMHFHNDPGSVEDREVDLDFCLKNIFKPLLNYPIDWKESYKDIELVRKGSSHVVYRASLADQNREDLESGQDVALKLRHYSSAYPPVPRDAMRAYAKLFLLRNHDGALPSQFLDRQDHSGPIVDYYPTIYGYWIGKTDQGEMLTSFTEMELMDRSFEDEYGESKNEMGELVRKEIPDSVAFEFILGEWATQRIAKISIEDSVPEHLGLKMTPFYRVYHLKGDTYVIPPGYMPKRVDIESWSDVDYVPSELPLNELLPSKFSPSRLLMERYFDNPNMPAVSSNARKAIQDISTDGILPAFRHHFSEFLTQEVIPEKEYLGKPVRHNFIPEEYLR